jgi:uncharacterized protein YkwD
MSRSTHRGARRPWATAGVLVALVLACSGSGEGGGGPTAPQPLPTAQVEAGSFGLINTARAGAGVPAVALDPALSAIARAHSAAMRDLGFFDHVDPQGQSFNDRLRAAGQPYSSAGENLARVFNAPDPAAFAHQRLLESGEHRTTMLNPIYDRVGVGVVRSGDTYWITQLYVR